MNRLCVSPRFVALRFSHIVPSAAMAAAAIRRALRSEGLAPWQTAEAEVFSAGGSTLVIARPREKKPLCTDSTK